MKWEISIIAITQFIGGKKLISMTGQLKPAPLPNAELTISKYGRQTVQKILQRTKKKIKHENENYMGNFNYCNYIIQEENQVKAM